MQPNAQTDSESPTSTSPATPDQSRLRMMGMCSGHWVTQCLSVVARLRVADQLASGPRPVEEIAEAVDAHADSLYRVMRALSDVQVFEELEGRRFDLGELGGYLRSDTPGSLRNWAIMYSLPLWREMWSDLLETVRTGQPTCERVFGKGPFEIVQDDPESARVFDDAMTEVSSGFSAAVATACDFSSSRTVVDVGGGNGATLAAVLAANPHVRGILHDRPPVVAGAPPVLEDSGVADRCEVVGGDFFASVPPGGDTYMLVHVIHNWSDERAVQILTNCRDAMVDGGRLLVIEDLLPEGSEPSISKAIDLEMLHIGGRERTPAEFAELFRQAGFEMINQTPGGMFSVLEAVAK